MNLRDLRYLVAVADMRRFGQAAEACHVSQPTLSTQLRKLEESLGVALFERTNKSVTVTPIGDRIVERARRVLEEADAIPEIAKAGRDPMAGPLRLGIIPTLGPYLLPWILGPIGARFPDLSLTLSERLTEELLGALRAHALDAAILATQHDDGEVAGLPLFDEPFWVAFPPGHRFTGIDQVTEADLRAETLLLLSEGHCLRDQALSGCLAATGPSARRLGNLQATSLETIRQMVAAGHGCTLLPTLAARATAGEAGNAPPLVRPLVGDGASRRVSLVYRRSTPRLACFERLADLIRAQLPDGVASIRK